MLGGKECALVAQRRRFVLGAGLCGAVAALPLGRVYHCTEPLEPAEPADMDGQPVCVLA